MMGTGIDYGLGRTNIDLETGIRYGVISVHSLERWHENAEADYGEAACPNCGDPLEDSHEREHENANKDYYCPECDESFWSDVCFGDEAEYTYKAEGYEAFETDLGVFVTKSPYYTLARFCSPCAPGAGDLNSPDVDGVQTYCFGHDWFDGPAPYPVYSVATGALVEPPTP